MGELLLQNQNSTFDLSDEDCFDDFDGNDLENFNRETRYPREAKEQKPGCLPAGWRICPSSLVLPPASLSLSFPSLAAAYQCLTLSQGPPSKEKDQLFSSLEREGWLDSYLLPKGWRVKLVGSNLSFISREGDFIQYMEAFIAWMRATGRFTSEEVEMAKLLKAGERTTDMVARDQEEEDVDESLEVKEAVEGTAQVYEDIEDTTEVEKWTESESESTIKAESNIKAETVKLPAGWTAWSNNGVKSAEGTKYKSKGKAIMDLIKNGGSPQTIETLRSLYLVEGFTRMGLPYGWMGRRTKYKEYIFITTEGHEIHSKGKAIKHLQENIYSKEEISMVDKFLQGMSNSNQEEGDVELTTEVEEDVVETTEVFEFENYKSESESKMLGLAARREKKTKMVTTDQEEDNVEESHEVEKSFEGTANVSDDIEDTSEVVDFTDTESESATKADENIKTDTIKLPAGWTAWSKHGVKSPDGTNYVTKGKAIINLTKLGGSSETIEVLRELYLTEGFTREGLPDGWIGRKKREDYIFINPEGSSIHSKAKAINHLEENNSSKEEQLMIDQFCQGLSNKKPCMENFKIKVVPRKRIRNSNSSPVEEIAEIPGWKTWKLGGLTSPNGTNFESKARAIKHLVSTGGDFETILAIRKLYGAQGYTSETLPEGWMGRKNIKGFYFISPEGNFLTGKLKAIDHLLEINGTDEDQSKITTFNIGMPKSETYSTDRLDWEASEYLPDGWMGRMNSDSVGILSAEGEQFDSFDLASEFMKSSEAFTEEDINALYLYKDLRTHEDKNKMKKPFLMQKPEDLNNWFENEYLPEGWMCQKKPKNQNRNIKLRSIEGRRFNSYRSAMEYMKSMPKYTENDMTKLFLYPDGNNHNLNLENKKRKKVSVEDVSEGNTSQKKVKSTNEASKLTEDIKPIVLGKNSDELRNIKDILNGFNLSVTQITKQDLSQPGSGDQEQAKYVEHLNKLPNKPIVPSDRQIYELEENSSAGMERCEDNDWKCKECGKKPSPGTSESLKDHIKTEHVEDISTSCVICGKGNTCLKRKQCLKHHVQKYYEHLFINTAQ